MSLHTLSKTQYDWRKIEPVTMKANFIYFWSVETEFIIENQFDYKFVFYTSKMNEIWLYYHWLYFSSIILSFRQCGKQFRKWKWKGVDEILLFKWMNVPCGSGNPLPDDPRYRGFVGQPSICNPSSHAPCCSNHGWCGNGYSWCDGTNDNDYRDSQVYQDHVNQYPANP